MIFGLLKRFDDWLEEKTRQSRPEQAPPHMPYIPLREIEEAVEPPFDWELRRKVVEGRVAAEAKKEMDRLNAIYDEQNQTFHSEAKVVGKMLIVTLPEGEKSFNLDYVLTVDLVFGNLVRQEKSSYVLYDKVAHTIAETVPWYYDDRYALVEWPVGAEDDRVEIQWTENNRQDRISVPYGRGRALHNQIMNAIGGK